MTTHKSPVRIALIGAGMFGEFHVQMLRPMQDMGMAQLTAFAAKTPETVRRQEPVFGVPGYTDFRRLLDEHRVDAVHIVTPDHLHREIAVEAAQRGLHVLVEKPMDVTVEGCREMIAVARSAGVLLQVDFHKRFDPCVRAARAAIAAGKFGVLEYAYLWMETSLDLPTNVFRKWAHHSSPAWVVGIHMYDLGRWLLDAAPESVYATGQKRKLAGLGIDTFDSMQSHIRLKGGGTMIVTANWITPLAFESRVNQGVRLVGTEGFVEIDLQDRGAVYCVGAEGMKRPNEAFYHEYRGSDGRLRYSGYGYESIASFVENVRFLKEGGRLADLDGRYPSGLDGLRATQVALASHQSIESGAPVAIAE